MINKRRETLTVAKVPIHSVTLEGDWKIFKGPPSTWTTNAMAPLMDSVLKEIGCPVDCPINLQDVTSVTLNSQLFSAACPRISKEKTPPEGRGVCEQLKRILHPGPLLCVRQCWTPLPIQEAFPWRTCWLENRTAEKIKTGKYTGTPASNYVLATAINNFIRG